MKTVHLQLQRKSTLKLRMWHPDYLVYSALLPALAQFCVKLQGSLLDLGCGNSPYRPLLTNVLHYVPYDLTTTASRPDVVGVAQNLPFHSCSFDSVLCTQVLEHVPDPWYMLKEVHRVLRPGGKLLLSAPQAWRLHEEPFDFYRYTKYGLHYLVQEAGLQMIETIPQGGVWLLLGQSLNNTLWQKIPAKYSMWWFVYIVRTLCINVAFSACNQLWEDNGDTLNYVILACKSSGNSME